MEKYEKKLTENNVLSEVYCNKCGKLIYSDELKQKDDYIKVIKEWGYFSNKDMETHSFELCEECYDNLIKTFKFQPTITKK